ncbi:MAG: cbb3-type cytochrome c oxidase subunit 3 [Formivibrio sp.]|nr:cbb3-type cytochrome c oxidase subunit 3 [Formivibrio sp.]
MEWLTELRPLIAVLSFVCFIAICLWAWSKRSRSEFDDAAMIPFRENDQPETGNKQL